MIKEFKNLFFFVKFDFSFIKISPIVEIVTKKYPSIK